MSPARRGRAKAGDTKKHLFVCGCPRSGTSALWRLLVEHPKIVLGLERYIHLAFKGGLYTPELFERERFFDLRPGDTFYDDLKAFNPYYEQAQERFDSATWVGDKAPPLYLDYEGVEANFADAHVLFIVRNIFDVASSYQKRADDPDDKTWDRGRNYRRAVADWRDSLKRTLTFIAKPERRTRIDVICYEELFVAKADLTPLFASLGLDVPGSVQKQYDLMRTRSVPLEAKRGDGLNSAKRFHVATAAPFWLYRDILPKRLDLSGKGKAIPAIGD